MEMRGLFYYLLNGCLYRKTSNPADAECLTRSEVLLVLWEAHKGGCAEHAEAQSLARKVVHTGNLPIMKKDYVELV